MSNTYVNDRQTDDVERIEGESEIRITSTHQIGVSTDGRIVLSQRTHTGDLWETYIEFANADLAADFVNTAIHVYGNLCARELEALR